MGFIAETVTGLKAEARKMAEQLHKVVGPDRKVKVSFSAWAKEFEMLLRGHLTIVVQKTLDWYCANYGKEFTPVATNAKVFREKFKQIQAAMARTEVTEQHSDFGKQLEQLYTWPIEIIPYLPAIAKQTETNWNEFLESIEDRLKGKTDRTNREDLFLGRVVMFQVNFVVMWFDNLANSLKNKEHYHGDPTKLAFKVDSDRFKTFWHLWSLSWTGNAFTFDDLLKKLIAGD